MYRGSISRRRNRMSGRARKVIIGVTAAAIAGGAWAISSGVSGASENNAAACAGLDQAIQRNLDFMAGQQAHPTAQTAAILQNRQQVIDNINVMRKATGCTEAAPTGPPAGAGPATPPVSTQPAGKAGSGNAGSGNAGSGNAGSGNAGSGNVGGNAGNAGKGAGQVVCKGNTVTLSGEGGLPAASSGTFPIGTALKVTNLDNHKSITVRVTEPSGSCALLNNAAFEQVREPGKFLIRHVTIERVG